MQGRQTSWAGSRSLIAIAKGWVGTLRGAQGIARGSAVRQSDVSQRRD